MRLAIPTSVSGRLQRQLGTKEKRTSIFWPKSSVKRNVGINKRIRGVGVEIDGHVHRDFSSSSATDVGRQGSTLSNAVSSQSILGEGGWRRTGIERGGWSLRLAKTSFARRGLREGSKGR